MFSIWIIYAAILAYCSVCVCGARLSTLNQHPSLYNHLQCVETWPMHFFFKWGWPYSHLSQVLKLWEKYKYFLMASPLQNVQQEMAGVWNTHKYILISVWWHTSRTRVTRHLQFLDDGHKHIIHSVGNTVYKSTVMNRMIVQDLQVMFYFWNSTAASGVLSVTPVLLHYKIDTGPL